MNDFKNNLVVNRAICLAILFAIIVVSGCGLGEEKLQLQETRAMTLLATELAQNKPVVLQIRDYSVANPPTTKNVRINYIDYEIDSAEVHGDRDSWEHGRNCKPEDNWCEVTVFASLTTADSTIQTLCTIFQDEVSSVQIAWHVSYIWANGRTTSGAPATITQAKKRLPKPSKWEIRNYVDDFGDPTSERYMANISWIRGTFSNSATQDSPLNVKFLVGKGVDISIMLYEYARNNPVKSYDKDNYRVLIKADDGSQLRLTAQNRSDRLTLNRTDEISLHNALLKYTTLKFRIIDIDTPTTKYFFKINATGYSATFNKL